MNDSINWTDFAKIDTGVGTIVKVQDFLEAHNPVYKIHVDFGDKIGIKSSDYG